MPRPRRLLLRGHRVRPEAVPNGSTHFHRAGQLDTSGHGLPLCPGKSGGVRAHATSRGPGKRVALPTGEPARYLRTSHYCSVRFDESEQVDACGSVAVFS